MEAAISLSHEELDALMGGYLDEIFEDAAGEVEVMGSVARGTIAGLQIRLNDLETRYLDDQETIDQLQDDKDTLEGQITESRMQLHTEQQARQHEAEAAAEQADREKDDAIKQQREGSSKLADERIKQLQEEHKSELEGLRRELETAKRENRAQKDENSAVEKKSAEFQQKLADERTSKAGLVKDIDAIRADAKAARENAQQLKDQCTKAKKREQELEQERDDSKQELAEEVESKAGLITNMNEIRAEAKTARGEAQQWEDNCTKAEKSKQELEQKLKDLEAAECAQCETLSKQAISDKQQLDKAKLFEEQHQSDRQTWENKLAIAESEKQDLEKRLGDCQTALKLTRDSKDKTIMDDQQKHKVALEAKDKEHKEAIRSRNARIDNLEGGMREAGEKIADHDKNMAHALVDIRAAESRFKNSEHDLKNTQAKLATAQAELDGRTKQANDAYQAADKLWHDFEAIKATNEEILDASVTFIQ